MPIISQKTTIDSLNWAEISDQLNIEGYAVLPGFLASLKYLADELVQSPFVPRAPNTLGRGELFYYGANMPKPLYNLRQMLYPYLVPIVNRWNDVMNVRYLYPGTFQAFQKQNREAGQTHTLSYMSRLCRDDYLALHQRAEGEYIFPLQLVGLLSVPETDFTGGEFVMTEQRPRMQSRPIVLPLGHGDAAIISVARRPFKGGKGYYYVNLRHSISRLRHGQRIGIEVFFHDAPQPS